jgi:hypothetical protein
MGQVGLVGRRLVVAGGRVRRGEDESTGAGESGGIEDAERLGDVDIERPERIADGVGDPGPSGEVDDRVDAGDRLRDGRPIGQRRSNQLMGHASEIGEPADREVVQNPDPIASFDEEPDERRADEAGAAGDEDGSVQRRCAPADVPIPALGSGAQRTFWTNVAGSIRSRCLAIRVSIVSISSSLSSRGSSPSSISLECWAL